MELNIERLKFTIAFICTALAGFAYLQIKTTYETKIEMIIGTFLFIGCVGYTLTGIVLWFTGIDDSYFED